MLEHGYHVPLGLLYLKSQGTQGADTFWEVQLLNGQKLGKTPLTSTPDLPW